MPGDGSLGEASFTFGSNRRNLLVSHSTCASLKKAHSLLTPCSIFNRPSLDVRETFWPDTPVMLPLPWNCSSVLSFIPQPITFVLSSSLAVSASCLQRWATNEGKQETLPAVHAARGVLMNG